MWCAAITLLVVWFSASSGVAKPSVSRADLAGAAAAMKQQFTMLSEGQLGLEWNQLHPAQQALIPKAHYVECGSTTAGHAFTGFKVKDAYWEVATIPGTDVTARTLALTVTYSLDGVEATSTFHEIKVGRRWRWAVASPAAFAGGDCP